MQRGNRSEAGKEEGWSMSSRLCVQCEYSTVQWISALVQRVEKVICIVRSGPVQEGCLAPEVKTEADVVVLRTHYTVLCCTVRTHCPEKMSLTRRGRTRAESKMRRRRRRGGKRGESK